MLAPVVSSVLASARVLLDSQLSIPAQSIEQRTSDTYSPGPVFYLLCIPRGLIFIKEALTSVISPGS